MRLGVRRASLPDILVTPPRRAAFRLVMTHMGISTRFVTACAGAASLVLAACSALPETSSPKPSPSPSATATLTVTPPPSPTPLLSGGVPHGFAPNSVTFVSLELGWALGGAPCGSGTCLALVRTSDGGHMWSAAQAPPTTFAPWPYSTNLASGVSQVRFADPQDGWAFGPDLWSTHDGGVHWSKINLGSIWSLEAAGGQVHAVAFTQINTTNTVAMVSSPTNRDAWAKTGSLQLGGGPVPATDLVLQGGVGWVIENDRVVIAGARLASGHWASWKPPCTTTGGSAVLSAATRSSLVAVCEQGIWGGPEPTAVRVYFSSDGGGTFYGRGAALPGETAGSGNVVASPAPGVVVTDIYTGSRHELIETFNSAASWETVATISGSMEFTYLGFTSASQGVAIANGRATSVLLMTFDGGRHWSPVTF
jgi:hypothetical protein